MIEIYTSYFYQIRFFAPNMIPLSTAVWDPKWYYKHYQGNWYVDKRGVINGLRAEPFMPGPQLEGLCQGSCVPAHAEICSFLEKYKQQLDKLDFNEILTRTTNLCNVVALYLKIESPIPVLIVHETPSNPCSERGPIQQWFKENGIECREWQRT